MNNEKMLQGNLREWCRRHKDEVCLGVIVVILLGAGVAPTIFAPSDWGPQFWGNLLSTAIVAILFFLFVETRWQVRKEREERRERDEAEQRDREEKFTIARYWVKVIIEEELRNNYEVLDRAYCEAVAGHTADSWKNIGDLRDERWVAVLLNRLFFELPYPALMGLNDAYTDLHVLRDMGAAKRKFNDVKDEWLAIVTGDRIHDIMNSINRALWALGAEPAHRPKSPC